MELGANIGLNLDAIKRVYPDVKTYGVEINKLAFKIGEKNINIIINLFWVLTAKKIWFSLFCWSFNSPKPNHLNAFIINFIH